MLGRPGVYYSKRCLIFVGTTGWMAQKQKRYQTRFNFGSRQCPLNYLTIQQSLAPTWSSCGGRNGTDLSQLNSWSPPPFGVPIWTSTRHLLALSLGQYAGLHSSICTLFQRLCSSECITPERYRIFRQMDILIPVAVIDPASITRTDWSHSGKKEDSISSSSPTSEARRKNQESRPQ